MPWDSSSQLGTSPAAPAGQHMGRDGILGAQWPASLPTPDSPEQRELPGKQHFPSYILLRVSRTLWFPHFPSPPAFVLSQLLSHLHSSPGSSAALQLGVSLAIISLQLLKASENDPKRPPFSVRAKGSWWNHRGNTIFSVSTLAHGTSCHRVIPGQTVWQPLGVCSAQLSTSSRERNRNKCHPLDESCLFLFWGYSEREVSRKWTARKNDAVISGKPESQGEDSFLWPPRQNVLAKGSLHGLTAEMMHQGLQENEEALSKTSPQASEFLQGLRMELIRTLLPLNFPESNSGY